MAAASRPTGATISTRRTNSSCVIGLLQHPLAVAPKYGGSAQYMPKITQRCTDANAAAGFQHEFPNRPLMPPATLLQDRQGSSDGSRHHEKPQVQHGIGQITDVHGRLASEQSMLCEDKDREHAMLIEIGRQLVQLVVEITLPWHGIQIAVQGVNDDQLAAIFTLRTTRSANSPGEISAGSICRKVIRPLLRYLGNARTSFSA